MAQGGGGKMKGAAPREERGQDGYQDVIPTLYKNKISPTYI
jgi:hypothetical protein